MPSHPMRVRGLKCLRSLCVATLRRVAPHAGAWIEILNSGYVRLNKSVAPHAGAWIEIRLDCRSKNGFTVAPHAGAWIEITDYLKIAYNPESRTPCGCVD